MSSLDFRPEVLEAKKSSLWGTVLIKPDEFYERAFKVIICTTILFTALLFFGHYSTKETVQGLIEPKEGLVSLYAPQTGYIEDLFAQQGQPIHSQEKIISISTKQQLDSGGDYAQFLRKHLHEENERLLQKSDQLAKEYDLKIIEENIKASQRRMSLNSYVQQFPLQQNIYQALENQYERIKEVFEKGSIAKVQLERAEADLNGAHKELIVLENTINQLKTQVEHEALIFQQLQHELAEKNLLLQQQGAELQKQLIDVEKNTTSYVYSPFSGVVTQLYLKPGQFVRSGQHVADLRKSDDFFVAKLYVPSKSIGLIKINQSVSLRIHAYPYEHYGTLLGKVEHITDSLYQGEQHSQEPFYLVYVTVERQSMKSDGRYPLKQGLILDADIKTQELTIIQKILEPLYRMYQS